MKFNKFYITIFLRIILIVLSCFAFVFFIERDDNLLTAVFILILTFIQIIFLIKYVNRTNRDLAEFLIHLQQGDTSVLFSKENIENTFKGLSSSFEKINADLSTIRSEKIQKEYYLKYVIDNVKTGLIAYDETGKVEFINHQAKIFLNRKDIKIININSLDNEFIDAISKTKISESIIIKKIIHDEMYYLALSISEFKIESKKVTLCSIHDVKQEIEANEIESWQKLTSVLTHEMMNSLTPITSLAHAIKRYLTVDKELKKQKDINKELLTDVVENADIIENRSKGLLEFINNYRTITKLPMPKFETILAKELIDKMILLFEEQIELKKIQVFNNVNSNSKLYADKGMIEQVIINLLKNSIESFVNNTNNKIEINVKLNKNNKTVISVIDNGKGIKPEIMDDIFVPFFTTKEKGSGIGLSLSRQIMRLHNGTIIVNSKPNEETVISLVF